MSQLPAMTVGPTVTVDMREVTPGPHGARGADPKRDATPVRVLCSAKPVRYPRRGHT